MQDCVLTCTRGAILFGDMTEAEKNVALQFLVFSKATEGTPVATCRFCHKEGVYCDSVNAASICAHIPPAVAGLTTCDRERVLLQAAAKAVRHDRT
jgi:hypothetical protein